LSPNVTMPVLPGSPGFKLVSKVQTRQSVMLNFVSVLRNFFIGLFLHRIFECIIAERKKKDHVKTGKYVFPVLTWSF